MTCAGGLQNRYRICTQAAHGGSDCNGTAEEYMDCNTEPCPIVSTTLQLLSQICTA